MEEISVAYKLFHTPFVVQIPQHHLYSDDILQLLGEPSSGDGAVDRVMMSSPVDVTITIAEMAEYFAEGAGIRFHNPSDIPVIYSLVLEHLKNWAYVFSHVYPMTYPPLEDFVKLDDLAQKLHPLVSTYGNTPLKTGLYGRMAGIRAHSLTRDKRRDGSALLTPGGQVRVKPSANEYQSSLKAIINKLWSADYEHTGDSSLQGDVENRDGGVAERRSAVASRSARGR